MSGELAAIGRHLGRVVLMLRRAGAQGADVVGGDYIELQSRDARSFGVELVRLKPASPEPAVDFFAHAR